MTSDVRAALEAGDDGFHEIQLNGKQLVFLGMATTLVSVVIFLCGVLVGRGVKPLDTIAQAGGPQAFETPAASPIAPGAAATPAPAPPPTSVPPSGAAAAAAAPDAGSTEPTPQGDEAEEAVEPPPAPAAAPVAAATAPKAVEPPARAPVEVKRTPKPEPSRVAAVPPAVTPPAVSKPPVSKPDVTPAPAAPAVATTAPATGGAIAVQVGAFKTRGEADALARRLSGRGYAVYVMNPTDDGKAVYRVRVGNYATADEAQRISAKLTQQEKLKPWVIR
jgi:septal ring-binding cell division protein DamX